MIYCNCLVCHKMKKLKPIFNQKQHSHWLPNVNEIDTNNLKLQSPMQRGLRGLPTYIGNGISNAKLSRWGLVKLMRTFHLQNTCSKVLNILTKYVASCIYLCMMLYLRYCNWVMYYGIHNLPDECCILYFSFTLSGRPWETLMMIY